MATMPATTMPGKPVGRAAPLGAGVTGGGAFWVEEPEDEWTAVVAIEVEVTPEPVMD